jgi:hypothetical protein
VYRSSGTVWQVEQTLTTSNVNASTFGWSVAIDDNRIVVGSPEDQGSATFFAFDGVQWVETATYGSLTDNKLGWSVAIDGSYAVVGAPAGGQGSATVFEQTPSGWVEVAVLQPSDPNDSEFGTSVSISADRIAVGSPEDTGSVYVFSRQGSMWPIEQLIPTPSGQDDSFGESVAIDGARLLVGASNGGANGLAYSFLGSPWVLEQTFAPFGPGDETAFGRSVDLAGNLALIGAPENINGTAFLFKNTQNGWNGQLRLRDPGNENGDMVGSSVALWNATAAVGAPQDDDLSDGAGAVLIFGLTGDCEADIDGNGAVDLADLNLLLGSFGSGCDGCPQDTNGDGVVNLADLNAVLANFGNLCN